MIRSVLLLALGALGANALANLGTTCDVYEQERTNGLCANGADAAKCTDYCKGKFGGELLGSECSDERPNKKRECVCRLKCCNQGCWGDPHCWTCDGVKFGYQGMKKHFMLKPMTDYPNIPYFTIAQSNKVYQKGPMAILDISEVIVKDWKITVEIKTPDGAAAGYIVKVNDQVKELPHRWTKLDDHRERFVNIVFGNAAKTQVVLTTSFGLRIVYTTQGAGVDRYTDLSIDTPRHPELKNHMHGLLGRWNDNPDDDSIDATGKKQPLDDGFSWAFGDSWIVPGGRTKTPECVRETTIKDKQHQQEQIDPETKKAAEKLCRDALENADFKDCAKKLRRAIPLLKNCIVDLIFLPNDKARKRYIEELVNSFRETCKRRDGKQPNGPHGHRKPQPSSEDEDDGNGGRRPKPKHPKRPDGDDSDEDGPHGGKPKHPNGPGGKRPKGRGDGPDSRFDDSDEDGPHGGKPKHPNGPGGKRPKGRGDGPDSDSDEKGPHGGKPKHPGGKKPHGDGPDSDEGPHGPHGGKPKHPGGKKPHGDGPDSDEGGPHKPQKHRNPGGKKPHGDGSDSDEGPDGGRPKHPNGPGGGKKPKGPRGDGPDDSDEGPHGGKPKHPNGPGGKKPKGRGDGPDDDSDEKRPHGGKPKHPKDGNGPGGKKPKGPKGPKGGNSGPDDSDSDERPNGGKPNGGKPNGGKPNGGKPNGGKPKNPKDTECAPFNLVPLYRMYKGATDNHFYTVNHDEAMNAVLKLGYTYEGIPGYVAINGKDCENGDNKLQPVYRLYKGGAKEDHFYTQNAGEADNANKNLGYAREGIAFYCPSTPAAQCGGSVGFQRYWRGTDHFYTENIDEGNKNVVAVGGKHEGVLCYIWPRPAAVKQ